jgi:hypothetical protein
MKVRGHDMNLEVKIQVWGTEKECGVKVKVIGWLLMRAIESRASGLQDLLDEHKTSKHAIMTQPAHVHTLLRCKILTDLYH